MAQALCRKPWVRARKNLTQRKGFRHRAGNPHSRRVPPTGIEPAPVAILSRLPLPVGPRGRGHSTGGRGEASADVAIAARDTRESCRDGAGSSDFGPRALGQLPAQRTMSCGPAPVRLIEGACTGPGEAESCLPSPQSSLRREVAADPHLAPAVLARGGSRRWRARCLSRRPGGLLRLNGHPRHRLAGDSDGADVVGGWNESPPPACRHGKPSAKLSRAV